MPQWQYRPGKWRYRFEHMGKAYGGAGFSTKKAARAGEEAHKCEVQQKLSPAPSSMDFLGAAAEYLANSKRKHAKKTYKYKAYVYDCFLTFHNNLPLHHITPSLIESYLKTRHSNFNYNRHLKDLSALFNWAWRRGMVPANPCLLIEKLPEEKTRRPVPTEDEVARILVAAGDLRPFILVVCLTMGRIGEVLRMRWEDVLFEHKKVILWTRKRKSGSLEPDDYPMSDTLHEQLMDLYRRRENSEWVFPNPKTGTQYFARPKIMRSICKKAGVPQYGFHSLRHFVANLLADKEKVSLKRVSRLLRHKNIRTTEIYLGKEPEGLRETVKLLDKSFQEETLSEKTSHESSHRAKG